MATGRTHPQPLDTQLDPRIDAYIAKSAEFARPILTYLRALVHEAFPPVRENVKWGMPSFEHKGILCAMAAFKQHCVLAFWNDTVVRKSPPAARSTRSVSKLGISRNRRSSARSKGMGEFGRITCIADLPPRRTLMAYIRKAVALREAGVWRPARFKHPPPRVPDDLAAALKAEPRAALVFKRFPPSHRREYIEWLTEAKKPETRARRLATTIEWLLAGKSRNWKYEHGAERSR